MSDDWAWLPKALGTGHPSDEACRVQLAEGASVHGGGDPVDTTELIDIYRRRVAHLQRIEARFTGADICERLASSGHNTVRSVGVHGRENFVLFLAPDADAVVATIGVDGALANPNFTAW